MLKYNVEKQRHRVRYIEDGVSETIDLEAEEWRIAPNPDGSALKLKLRLDYVAQEAVVIESGPKLEAAV